MGRGAGAQLAAPGSGYCAGAAGSGYPPGNQLLIPGERFNATIVRYLEFARDFNEKFPGFETDIHGLVKDGNCGAACYHVDCVAKRIASAADCATAIARNGSRAASPSLQDIIVHVLVDCSSPPVPSNGEPRRMALSRRLA